VRIFLRVFILFILLECGVSNEGRFLQLALLGNEVRISHVKGKRTDPCVTTCANLKFSVKNFSSDNFILYNFQRFFQLGELNDSTYCDGNGAAESIAFVYNTKNEQIMSARFLPDSIHWKPMPMEKVLDRRELSKIWFRNTKLVIRTNESLVFSRNIDFREFDLLPGSYFVKILYYQQDVSNYITQEQLQEDIKKYDAYLLKGCLWSNSVRLIVE
jgi:hypothetical protein